MSDDVVVDAAAAMVVVQNAATVTAAAAAATTARVIVKPTEAAAVALVAVALVDINGATVVAYVDDTANAVMTTVASAPASGGNARLDRFTTFCESKDLKGMKTTRNRKSNDTSGLL